MKKNILFVSHFSGNPGGPVDKLYSFIKPKYHVSQIKFPLWPDKKMPVTIDIDEKFFEFKVSPRFQFLLEGFLTFLFLFKKVGKLKPIDLAICFDSLSFIDIYLFNFFYNAKKIIFYNIDYSKKRFANPFLNFIYQQINKFAYKKCDYFFSLYESLIKDIDPSKKLSSKSFLIKSTVNLEKINYRRKKRPFSLVYAGVLDYGTVNFDPMLKALSALKKAGIKFELDLYGRLTAGSELENKIKRFGLNKKVNFKGVVENNFLVNEILPTYKIGVAPYAVKGTLGAPDHAFLGTDLTAKIVDYLGAGLPVVTVELNNGFRVITKYGCGFLVKSPKEWYEALRVLLTDYKTYESCRKNSLSLAKNYDIKKVLGGVFEEILA